MLLAVSLSVQSLSASAEARARLGSTGSVSLREGGRETRGKAGEMDERATSNSLSSFFFAREKRSEERDEKNEKKKT